MSSYLIAVCILEYHRLSVACLHPSTYASKVKALSTDGFRRLSSASWANNCSICLEFFFAFSRSSSEIFFNLCLAAAFRQHLLLIPPIFLYSHLFECLPGTHSFSKFFLEFHAFFISFLCAFSLGKHITQCQELDAILPEWKGLQCLSFSRRRWIWSVCR